MSGESINLSCNPGCVGKKNGAGLTGLTGSFGLLRSFKRQHI